MVYNVKGKLPQLVDLHLALNKTGATSLGRIHSIGTPKSQMWWRPLHAPEGAPNGAVSARSKVSPKDVLVVEDESYLCDLIADVLESDGHSARKASNGREALGMLEDRKPQLILLDLMMPIMDGWEFMAQMQARPEWTGIPVIIITAIYDAKRTQKETGARAVITKPFDIDHLSELVNLYAL